MSIEGVVADKIPADRLGFPDRSGDSDDSEEPELKATRAVPKKEVLPAVVLVSPALADANNGNWHTAHRWSQFLSRHCDIRIVSNWAPGDRPADLMVALHARRSAPSIAAWACEYPNKPLVVVLTGTDLYRDIQDDLCAQHSLAVATHLVVLQSDGLTALPERWRSKTRVIFQSAAALKPAAKHSRLFRALMVGHLRDEKDPLTFMAAAGHPLPSSVRLDQIGDDLDPVLGTAARATAAEHPHYRWLGGLSRSVTRQHIKRAQLLVSCSRMEGGAHVILEAVLSGTAVLASRVGGNVGMLGSDYAGYFPLGDSAALATLVRRCANEPDFLAALQRQCAQRVPLFDARTEEQLVINLITSALSAQSASCLPATERSA
ncbi:MAG: TIGR04348 family glycosyltransferase [Polaromonas sp.]|nr:TIGR04348 family glycosyltransferase [Polaromonas sp.]